MLPGAPGLFGLNPGGSGAPSRREKSELKQKIVVPTSRLEKVLVKHLVHQNDRITCFHRICISWHVKV